MNRTVIDHSKLIPIFDPSTHKLNHISRRVSNSVSCGIALASGMCSRTWIPPVMCRSPSPLVNPIYVAIPMFVSSLPFRASKDLIEVIVTRTNIEVTLRPYIWVYVIPATSKTFLRILGNQTYYKPIRPEFCLWIFWATAGISSMRVPVSKVVPVAD